MNRWRIRRLYDHAQQSWMAGLTRGLRDRCDGDRPFGSRDEGMNIYPWCQAEGIAYTRAMKDKRTPSTIPADVWAMVLAEAQRPRG